MAAEADFPGKGEARSAGAMGAFVESLEVKFGLLWDFVYSDFLVAFFVFPQVKTRVSRK